MMQDQENLLEEFLITHEIQIKGKNNNEPLSYQTNHQTIPHNQIPNIMFYMKGIALMELLLILITIFSEISLDYQRIIKYISYILLIGSAGGTIKWALVGIKKNYIGAYWGIFWIHYAVGAFFSSVILEFKNFTACFWLLIASCIFMGILQLKLKKSIYRLFIVLLIDTPCIEILSEYVKRKDETKPVQMEFSLFISVNIVFFVALVILIVKTRKWNTWNYKTRMFMLSLYYLLTLAVVAGAAGCIASVPFPWPVFTLLNHAIFLCIFIYLKSILPKTYSFFRRIKNTSLFKKFYSLNAHKRLYQQKNEKLFLISRGLLCQKQDYIQVVFQKINQSLIRVSLADCICCMSQESSFVYEECKHACIGFYCSVSWIEKGIKKCPICRTPSSTLIRVQRENYNVFNVIGRYRIGRG